MKKNILKYLLGLVVFISLSVYSFNSMCYVVGWFSSSSNLRQDLLKLQKQKAIINEEIAIYNKKVSGIREETLDRDILEIQAKALLNLIKEDEILIIK